MVFEDYLVNHSIRDFSLQASSRLEFLRRAVMVLMGNTTYTPEDGKILASRLIAAQRAGTFFISGLYLPHLVCEPEYRGVDQAGWFVWKSADRIQVLEKGCELCLLILGSTQFVEELTRIGVALAGQTGAINSLMRSGNERTFRERLRGAVRKINTRASSDGKGVSVDPAQDDTADGWVCATATIPNTLGLHARATAKLLSLAQQFPCEIRVSRRGQAVDGKSIIAIMMLACSRGDELEICARGSDAEEAIRRLTAMIQRGFCEEQSCTIVYAKYDCQPGSKLFIRGSAAPLSWERGMVMYSSYPYGSEAWWTWDTDEIPAGAEFEFKLLINDQVWEPDGQGPASSHRIKSKTTINVVPRFS